MRIEVNGVRLFFDVDGEKYTPDGPKLREKPTLIVLHGGPGSDHSGFKPYFSRFSDIAQIVYLDHRGNGRSDDGAPEHQTLAQWGDDVAAFCRALEIDKPVIYGLSFGGFVAQSVATRHPELPSGLILASTACRSVFERKYAAFEALGGIEARRVAERFWGGGIADDASVLDDWAIHCLPHYSTTPQNPEARKRVIKRETTERLFFREGGERWRMDFRDDLAKVACATLVMAGDMDPVTPPSDAEEIVAHLPDHLVEYALIAGTGHGPHRDKPDEIETLLRGFLRNLTNFI
jgi:proline iminopeptidase